jgi:uncharacterized membrane protein YphA (DoxX/SURF4 family)
MLLICEVASLAAGTSLALVFFTAGLSKLWDMAAAIRAVSAYRLVSPRLARFIGVVLPICECTLAGWFLIGAWTLAAALGALGLLAVFTCAHIVILLRRQEFNVAASEAFRSSACDGQASQSAHSWPVSVS